MSYSLTDLDDGGFRFAGRIDLQNAGAALGEGLQNFKHYRDITVDIGEADFASTVGLALLLEWSTVTSASGRRISFVNGSPILMELLRVNGVRQLLSISNYEKDRESPYP
ncbi:MAG: STAS domain-containing protein [Woeseiaceae bacterium]|nr:STAS domain-containing protein [Woeseiaceae bacterium]